LAIAWGRQKHLEGPNDDENRGPGVPAAAKQWLLDEKTGDESLCELGRRQSRRCETDLVPPEWDV
jgi:hypothetical protein